MAQRASLRDQTSLAVEKGRSNRTVYVLRNGVRAASSSLARRWRAPSAVVRNYRALKIGWRRTNRLVLTVSS